MKIKNILFDMGGVIITLDQQQAIQRFKSLGLEDANKWLDQYTQQGIFGEIEEGRIDEETFRSSLSVMSGRQLSLDDCRYGWLGYVKNVPQHNLLMLQQLRKEGFKVILVSNTNPFMMSWVLSEDFDGQGHGLDHYVDKIYTSYQIGYMKPSEHFFRHVLDKEGISPDESLFVDDGLKNVQAAQQLGLHTYHAKNGEDWTKDIHEFILSV